MAANGNGVVKTIGVIISTAALIGTIMYHNNEAINTQMKVLRSRVASLESKLNNHNDLYQHHGAAELNAAQSERLQALEREVFGEGVCQKE